MIACSGVALSSNTARAASHASSIVSVTSTAALRNGSFTRRVSSARSNGLSAFMAALNRPGQGGFQAYIAHEQHCHHAANALGGVQVAKSGEAELRRVGYFIHAAQRASSEGVRA